MTATAPHPDRVILPPALRTPAAAVSVGALLVFGVLAGRYADDSTAGRLDRKARAIVGSTDGGPSIADVVISLGNAESVVAFAVALCAVALALGRRRLALLAIAGPGLTGVATSTLKPIIGRTIEGQFAYPSGHTGGATSLGLVAALLLVAVLRPPAGASAAVIAAGAVLCGGTMALALVADGDHYATDTVGGFCVAVAVVFSCVGVIERWRTDDAPARAAP
ncbi:MAG TPA: phosphatase PAP2 family protein [Pseudonocardia sp.]|uniref:phosphatase PAP2 family protein n=1 Tax=Pseudonocardia sp. TaxID=60912 RepID=UPI002B4AF597|nr:phosphatase PAP2 family protein [Pseudonocardia sp.]HLU59355.1 phosphatase PAP2 family protein [Pseudonocardia sp.]